MKVVGLSGKIATQADSFDWGCSHSGYERIAYDSRKKGYASTCKTDSNNRIRVCRTRFAGPHKISSFDHHFMGQTIQPVVSIAQSEEAWIEETEDEEEIIAEGLLLLALPPRPRAPLTVRAKLKWDRELNMLQAESQFEACYRMPTAAFVRLEAVLAPLLLRSPHAWVRRGWIACDNALQLTLRYLAGGSMHDIRRIAGVSKASFYRIVWPFLERAFTLNSLHTERSSLAVWSVRISRSESSISPVQDVMASEGLPLSMDFPSSLTFDVGLASQGSDIVPSTTNPHVSASETSQTSSEVTLTPNLPVSSTNTSQALGTAILSSQLAARSVEENQGSNFSTFDIANNSQPLTR
ncbi:unnamed protein product [Phytophthora fragariaefolia]|uniref:Unnamed protein product n=1 Tax=Phytophthora fragariaefolia TaxID=1490495 RepID=A0A9W7CKN5_9STRA|nr:unnamed protein product [Phytophthora fragariaefolia]